mmetsp:Transcript_81459/g.217897  ORF Transcript_81459/g.217897 Transcript_81459/m.217897 type:complete len:329 (-) Transcript_81459:941-1927(-)
MQPRRPREEPHRRDPPSVPPVVPPGGEMQHVVPIVPRSKWFDVERHLVVLGWSDSSQVPVSTQARHPADHQLAPPPGAPDDATQRPVDHLTHMSRGRVVPRVRDVDLHALPRHRRKAVVAVPAHEPPVVEHVHATVGHADGHLRGPVPRQVLPGVTPIVPAAPPTRPDVQPARPREEPHPGEPRSVPPRREVQHVPPPVPRSPRLDVEGHLVALGGPHCPHVLVAPQWLRPPDHQLGPPSDAPNDAPQRPVDHLTHMSRGRVVPRVRDVDLHALPRHRRKAVVAVAAHQPAVEEHVHATIGHADGHLRGPVPRQVLPGVTPVVMVPPS